MGVSGALPNIVNGGIYEREIGPLCVKLPVCRRAKRFLFSTNHSEQTGCRALAGGERMAG